MKEIKILKYELTGVRNPFLKVIGTYENTLDITLLGDNKKIKYNIEIFENKKSFIITSEIKGIKNIALINNRDDKVIIKVKNRKYKRIVKKLSSKFLDLFTDVIYEINDFIGVQDIKITGISNPVIEIKGTIIKDNCEFYLIKKNNEKIKLEFTLKNNNFSINHRINKNDKKMALIVKCDNKEYYVAKIKNKLSKRVTHKLKSLFYSNFYKLYPNSKIEFANISLEGVIHTRLTISGRKENNDIKITFKSNGKILKQNMLATSEPDEFYHFVNLKKEEKKIYIYVNEELILEIKNRIYYKFFNKIFSIVRKIFNKIYHIIYVLYRGVRAAWKQYHFLIPPRLWKKYWIEFKNKMRSKENGLFYNPDNISNYNKWLKTFEREDEILELKYQPLISILIPVYNIERKYLSECINSILNQTYQNFEICLVDDASTKEETIETLKEYQRQDSRIKVKFHKKNGHISKTTNDALEMAQGEFIGLVDNDDLLAANALYEIVKVLNENKKLDFIYSDEDKINEHNERCYPHFKPDFSPDTLLSLNYICHFSVLRKKIVECVNGFEIGLEGAQDHDLFLKVSEITNRIYHIPKILYHWRMISGSTSATLDNKSYANDKGKKAIENALKRRKLNGEVKKDDSGYYIVNYRLKKEPLISIIIPTKDYSDTLTNCLVSLYKKTIYKNFEVIVVNNNSVEDKTFKLFDKYKKEKNNFKVVDANMEFNYSKINNLAVKQARGEYIVLLNNDTEIITPEWLDIMVGYARLDHIGAVGAKLLYPDGTVQHGGVILGLGGVASHAYIGASRKETGAYGRLRVPYNYSAVTAACLMVKKSKYEIVNGLEEKLKVAYNDMDFNIKLLEKGYYNIFLPQVELFHHESKSRGYDTTTEKYERFLKESEYMNKKWENEIKNDKFYNSNFSKRGWFMLDKERRVK